MKMRHTASDAPSVSIKLVSPVTDSPMARQVQDAPSAEEIKRREKEEKRRLDAVRPLDAWERYRALVDATEEAFELIDIANREARFALIMMGALNAVPLVLLSRADAFSVLSRGEQSLMGGLFVGYAALVLTFILRAIEALKPERFRPELEDWPAAAPDRPAGIRYYEDIVKRSAHEHWAAWQTVRVSQLNAELAVQVHGLALRNQAKHIALRRLYAGLRLMALALAGLSLLFLILAGT
jgi:hypothetical protein